MSPVILRARKTNMQIVSTASAFPQHYYSQDMLLAALQDFWGDKIENQHVLRRLHRHVGVDGRYLAIPKEEYLRMKTWGEANNHWIRTAKELGEKAITGALAGAGLHARNLGRIFFTSVTGICSPSIDALLINQMGLCRNIRRVPIFGLGCVAGRRQFPAPPTTSAPIPTRSRSYSPSNSARSRCSAKTSPWPT